MTPIIINEFTYYKLFYCNMSPGFLYHNLLNFYVKQELIATVEAKEFKVLLNCFDIGTFLIDYNDCRTFSPSYEKSIKGFISAILCSDYLDSYTSTMIYLKEHKELAMKSFLRCHEVNWATGKFQDAFERIMTDLSTDHFIDLVELGAMDYKMLLYNIEPMLFHYMGLPSSAWIVAKLHTTDFFFQVMKKVVTVDNFEDYFCDVFSHAWVLDLEPESHMFLYGCYETIYEQYEYEIPDTVADEDEEDEWEEEPTPEPFEAIVSNDATESEPSKKKEIVLRYPNFKALAKPINFPEGLELKTRKIEELDITYTQVQPSNLERGVMETRLKRLGGDKDELEIQSLKEHPKFINLHSIEEERITPIEHKSRPNLSTLSTIVETEEPMESLKDDPEFDKLFTIVDEEEPMESIKPLASEELPTIWEQAPDRIESIKTFGEKLPTIKEEPISVRLMLESRRYKQLYKIPESPEENNIDADDVEFIKVPKEKLSTIWEQAPDVIKSIKTFGEELPTIIEEPIPVRLMLESRRYKQLYTIPESPEEDYIDDAELIKIPKEKPSKITEEYKLFPPFLLNSRKYKQLFTIPESPEENDIDVDDVEFNSKEKLSTIWEQVRDRIE